MEIKAKIFLQFLSSWTLMPLVLLLAQLSGIADQTDFIESILAITSVVPVQIYLNEVFVPRAVCFGRGISPARVLEVVCGTLLLSTWLAWSLNLSLGYFLLVIFLSQGYIWFSYFASRRILECQANALISGFFSYVIGAIIPLTFLFLMAAYWLLDGLDFNTRGLFYLLILLPNLLQYFFVWVVWGAGQNLPSDGVEGRASNTRQPIWIGFFMIAIFMAIVAQHWKVTLASSAAGYAALSIYLIVPFSSAWLILSKSRYLARDHSVSSPLIFWGGPVLVVLTLLLDLHGFTGVFLLALITQVLTFKFITDTRARISMV